MLRFGTQRVLYWTIQWDFHITKEIGQGHATQSRLKNVKNDPTLGI